MQRVLLMTNKVITKECNECKRELPIYEFGFSPSRGTNFSKCQECTKKRKKKWYNADPSLKCHPWRKKLICPKPPKDS